jgi:hypothetical protein
MTKAGQKFVLKIVGGDAQTMKSQIEMLAKLTGEVLSPDQVSNVEVSLPALLDGMNSDEFVKYVRERLMREGFDIEITARDPEPKPEVKGKRGRRLMVDAETAARKLKGNGEAAAEPNFEQTDAPAEIDAEGARQQVIGFLSKEFEIPEQRPKVTDFSNRQSKKHGKSGEKLSLLPTEAFPAILVAMKKEFGA